MFVQFISAITLWIIVWYIDEHANFVVLHQKQICTWNSPKYRFYNDSPYLSNLRLIKFKIVYQIYDIVIKWNNGGISITIMCAPLFSQCVFSYLIVCFCATPMVKGCWMRHFKSLLFRFVLMDVIPIKLKCRYIILSVTGGEIISCCDVFLWIIVTV